MGNQRHISPPIFIGFFAGILLGVALTFLFATPNQEDASSSRQEQEVTRRWGLDREAVSIDPITRVPSLTQDAPSTSLAHEEESKDLEKAQSALLRNKAVLQKTIREYRNKIEDLHAQLIEAKYTLMLAIEDPDSTPYGSFLASTAGEMATFDERRDAWYTLSDLPVKLTEAESIWLLDNIQRNSGGVVPLEEAIAFLGPGRVFREVPKEKLLELKDYYDDREWEAMFPTYLRTKK